MSRKRSEVIATAHPGSMRARIQDIRAQLCSTFIGREEAIDAMILAHLTGQHYLLVGEPGTAKTAVARALASHITGAAFFKELLGQFTTPEKVFGPLDVEQFTVHKRYAHATAGMLPEADLGFLDEYLKGSDGLVNELLGLLNEREFGGNDCPLWTCGMATNWPELERRTDKIEALYDRTLLRVVVDDLRVPADVAKMLASAGAVRNYAPNATITMDELRATGETVRGIPVCDAVLEVLAEVRQRLAYKKDSSGSEVANVTISSRRLAALLDVLRAQAWLAGDAEVKIDHFAALRHGLWTNRSDIEQVAAVLKTVDHVAVQRCEALIADGVRACKALQGRPKDDRLAAAVNGANETILKIATQARDELLKPIFTAASRARLDEVMRNFKAEFTKTQTKLAADGVAVGG